MRTVLTIMTTTRDSIAALTAEVRALREEVGWLRSQVGTRTGTEPGPVVQPQTTRPLAEPYSQDPRHDPAYVEAAMRGDLPAMRTALAAAKQRISAEITAPRGRQPASVAELDLLDARQSGRASHQQRRAQAQDMLSLAHVDSRGGAMERHPGGTQVTVRHAAGRTCQFGHPAESDGQKFCSVCGSALSAPELGKSGYRRTRAWRPGGAGWREAMASPPIQSLNAASTVTNGASVHMSQ